MAKSTTKKRSTKSSPRSKKSTTVDKIAKAAMSREMLGAGLAAAEAATSVMSTASKLGELIAEAVADAAQRVMSGKWSEDEGSGGTARANSAGGASRSRSTGTKRASTGGARKKSTARKTTTRKTAA